MWCWRRYSFSLFGVYAGVISVVCLVVWKIEDVEEKL